MAKLYANYVPGMDIAERARLMPCIIMRHGMNIAGERVWHGVCIGGGRDNQSECRIRSITLNFLPFLRLLTL